MPNSGDQTAQKWALLIGINSYPLWAEKHQLRACINDVEAIRKVLTSERFGFPEKHILALTSPAGDGAALATRQNILDAFKRHLIHNEKIQAGDVVFIYYSGHGSYVPDEDGDEEDRYDETLVPCNSGPEHENDIIDDEISDLLERLAARTQNINLIIDSCHSGTVTRAMMDAEEGDAQDRVRWLPPPAAIEAVPAPSGSPGTRGTREMGPSDWLPLSDGYVVIAACHAQERARERRFRLFKHYGILTYCLLKALRDVGPETTYYDIWQDVQLEVTKRCHSQHPQIEGAFERKVFGGAALPRKRYVQVLEVAGDRVTLAAGLVHGATAGSRFAIYPVGTESFEDSSAAVAVVRLADVGPFQSTAAFERGNLAKVTLDSPAIEIEHDYGSMQMIVHVVGDDPVLQDVGREITRSPLLSLKADDEATATATVRLRYPLQPDGTEDTARGKMLCILSSGDGHALVEPIVPDGAGPATACEKLEHIARYYNMLAIRNTDPDSELAGKVTLRLLKEVQQGGVKRTVPLERGAGGAFRLAVGDVVVVEVTNRSEKTVHIAVLDCGPNWEVCPLFPPEGAPDDRVAGGQPRRTIRFEVYSDKPIDERLPLPRETLKLFATTEQASFRSFWQPATRALAGGEGTSLDRLVGLATGGGETRATRSMGGKEGDWTTDELVFYITA
ncbi:MAG: caspase family protein [Anaerolineae bacterium]